MVMGRLPQWMKPSKKAFVQRPLHGPSA
jgi:hypothetical protein